LFRTSTSFCAAQPHSFLFCGAQRRSFSISFCAAQPHSISFCGAQRRPVLNLNLVLCGAAALVLVLRRAAPPVLNLNLVLDLVLRRAAPHSSSTSSSFSTSFCAAQPHSFSFCGAQRRPISPKQGIPPRPHVTDLR